MTIARRSGAAAPAGGSTTPPASPDQLLTAPQLEYSDSDSAATEAPALIVRRSFTFRDWFDKNRLQKEST